MQMLAMMTTMLVVGMEQLVIQHNGDDAANGAADPDYNGNSCAEDILCELSICCFMSAWCC